jgi:hypothetical protein
MTDLLELPFTPQGGKPPTAVLHRLLDAISLAGDKKLILTLKEHKKKRSLSQNAYYWGVVLPPIVRAFREHGNNVDAEDVHAYLKDHVGKLKQHFITPDGEVLTGPGSTAKLTTMEFEDYLAKVRAWAAETLGVAVPMPNEGPADA